MVSLPIIPLVDGSPAPIMVSQSKMGGFMRKLSLIVLGLLIAFPALAGAPEDAVTKIEGQLRPHFPTANFEKFECGDVDGTYMCKNVVSFGGFGINYILKVSPTGNLRSAMLMMAGPAYIAQDNPALTKMMTMAFGEASLSVLELTASPLPVGKRLTFITKAMGAGDDGVVRNGWRYSGGAGFMTTFMAEKVR